MIFFLSFCVPQPEQQYYHSAYVSPVEESTYTQGGNELPVAWDAVENQLSARY